jgi:hypothetical protein
VHPGRETLTHYFSCSDGSGADPKKSTMRDVTLNLGFLASSAICWSVSAFWCVRGVKQFRNIMDSPVGLVCIL